MNDTRIYNAYQPVKPISPPAQPAVKQSIAASKTAAGASFKQVLQQELSGVTFSQHALQRLQSRQIQLSSTELTKLNQAVDKAAEKGAKESLILLNDKLAFVVSVKNKTVITAMDSASIKDNVFTNIDSAVIV